MEVNWGNLKYFKYVPAYFFVAGEKTQTTEAPTFLFWKASKSFPQIKLLDFYSVVIQCLEPDNVFVVKLILVQTWD